MSEIDWSKEATENSNLWKSKVFEEATRLATCGYHVFPLRRLGKASVSAHLCHHSASSNPKTIAKWFNPTDGEYAGFNLGLSTGGNRMVAVLDLDFKAGEGQENAVDGIRALADLESKHGSRVPMAMTSRTPSGGRHVFLAWNEGIRHGTNVYARGIDVRSGSKNSSSGHVVVYPSVVDGKMYQWETDISFVTALPPAPSWMLKATASKSERPDWLQNSDSGNEEVSESDMLSPVSKQDVVAMLDRIAPKELDYNEWLQVGMAIYSQWPDRDGLQIWDDWSSQDSARWKPGDCASRWAGFDQVRVTIGTLIWMAQKHGWKSGPRDEILVALERINRETPGVLVKGKERWILTNQQDGVSFMPRSAAMLYHAIHRVNVGSDEKPKLVNPLVLWDSWKDRQLYHGVAIYPHPAPPNPKMFNAWGGFAYQPSPGNVKPWLEFVQKVIESESDREWIHDWIAQMFQNPGIKPTTSLVFRGTEGIGKNTFTDTIGMLFNPINRAQFEDTDQALSQFNNHMLFNVWLVMNEALWSGNHKHANKLKGMVTEPQLTVELKGVDKFVAPNYSHVAILTNEDWAVPAGMQSRRFMVVDFPDALRGNTQYFEKFRAWRSRPESLPALLYWYQHRAVTHDLHRAPENDALQRQRVFTEIRSKDSARLEVLFELLNRGQAARHDGDGQWSGAYFWPVSTIRNAWTSVTGKKMFNAPASIRSIINRVCGFDADPVVIGEYDSEIKKVRKINGVYLPNTPTELLEGMVKFGLIGDGDAEVPDAWEDLPRQNW